MDNSAELRARLEASDASPATLEMLHATVTELCCQYAYRDATVLRDRARGWLNRVLASSPNQTVAGRRTELLVRAGRLALLVGCLEYDLGMATAAEASRRLARQLGTQVGDTDIVGWSWEMAAWFALTQGRYRDVTVAARTGRAVANRGHGVHVQLIAQDAKAHARLGDTAWIHADLELGYEMLAELSAPEHRDDHFVVDTDKWVFYAMDTYRLAGDDARAREYAEAVLDISVAANGTEVAPMRAAEARLTLATVACRAGDLETAVDLGLQAVDGHARRSLPSLLLVASELDHEIHRRYPREASAADFHEALRALRMRADRLR